MKPVEAFQFFVRVGRDHPRRTARALELAHTEPLRKNCHVFNFVGVIRSVCGGHHERFNAREELQSR